MFHPSIRLAVTSIYKYY
uniref:Uncharacterized protein n=1 Tax=Arundo donax TaxID=35708 RepID=A0A0A9C8Y2_ARUDO